MMGTRNRASSRLRVFLFFDLDFEGGVIGSFCGACYLFCLGDDEIVAYGKGDLERIFSPSVPLSFSRRERRTSECMKLLLTGKGHYAVRINSTLFTLHSLSPMVKWMLRSSLFALHSSLFTLHSAAGDSLSCLPCFSDVSLIGTYMSESFNSEHIESHIRVKREVHGRQKGGTWEDDPNIVNLYYKNTTTFRRILLSFWRYCLTIKKGTEISSFLS